MFNERGPKLPESEYTSIYKWISKREQHPPIRYKNVTFEDKAFLSPPRNLGTPLNWKFNPDIFIRDSLPPSFVSCIPGGETWGDQGIVLSPDKRLLWTIFQWELTNETYEIFRHQKTQSLKTTNLYAGADLRYVWSNNYYHWLYEVLPRFHFLHTNFPGVKRFIITAPRPHQTFQIKTLELLGISKEQLILTSKRIHVETEKLMVCSYRTGLNSRLKWVCNFLRKNFLGHKRTSKRPQRIYISRKNANYRKVVNEDQILTILSQYGFKQVTLERTSFIEQVELFSSAEAVVAPHGAGLANLVFCSPKTKVIELFSPLCIRNLYWAICSHTELNYYYLIGKGDIPKIDPNNGMADIEVDLTELKKLLVQTGL